MFTFTSRRICCPLRTSFSWKLVLGHICNCTPIVYRDTSSEHGVLFQQAHHQNFAWILPLVLFEVGDWQGAAQCCIELHRAAQSCTELQSDAQSCTVLHRAEQSTTLEATWRRFSDLGFIFNKLCVLTHSFKSFLFLSNVFLVFLLFSLSCISYISSFLYFLYFLFLYFFYFLLLEFIVFPLSCISFISNFCICCISFSCISCITCISPFFLSDVSPCWFRFIELTCRLWAGSVVSIATGYVLEGSGLETR